MNSINKMIKKIRNTYKEFPLPAKASFWFIICAVIEKGISFFTLPLFSRLLTTEQYGLVTLYYSWLGIICIFTTLNLQYGSLGTAQIKFERKKYAYASAIQILVSFLSVFVLLIAVCFSHFWEEFFQMPFFLIVMMIFESWAVFVIGVWNGNKRFDYKYKPIMVVTLIIAIMAPVIGIIAVIKTPYKAEARLVSLFGVEIIIAVILFIDTFQKGHCIYNKTYWKFALKFNIPIIPYYLSQVVFNTSDRIMISKISGQGKAGIYGLVYTVAFVLDFVRTSLNSGYGPWYYRKIKANEGKQVQQLNKRITIGAFVIICLFVLLGPEFVLLMGGEKYYPARWIVPLVSVSLLFSYLADYACYVEFYFEKRFSLVTATFLSAILNVVLNYLCIPYFGYMAASYTTLIAYILLWLCMYIGAKRTCKEKNIDEKQFINFSFQVKVAIGGILIIPIMLVLYQTSIPRYCICGIMIMVCLIFYKKIKVWLLQCLE